MSSILNEPPSGLNTLTASEAARKLAMGRLKSVHLVEDCLDRISKHDETLRAWAFVNADQALAQARACDLSDTPTGPLHGIPVGIKDVLDTYDMPTEYGSDIYRDHRPTKDSHCVAALRAAGAVLLGKTTTTQFASPLPVGVRNPHDTDRTPGVSSSGSAAAVADFMVPLANGTQTGGSVILPASFCGVVGYKASLDGLDRAGISGLKKSLDTLGYFARSAEDIGLVYQSVKGEILPVDAGRPKIGVCKTPMWDEAEDCSRAALEKAASTLSASGYEVADVELPRIFDTIEQPFRVISNYEGKCALAREFRDHMDKMNAWMQETGNSNWSEQEYRDAIVAADHARAALKNVYDEYPVLLTPSAAGEAPSDLVSVTMSSFNRLWTLMHGPTITLPCSTGPNGMPVGIQITSRVGGDAALIAYSISILQELQNA
ncbi:MAG: amidase [Pelagibacteraceae bacterium]|nr:amidase [Pelagibacteraceae bacterium]PPR10059.1 MAG: putative amidase AmiD [Alphaproteobacteria bacterium MarineAlpha11_Bin1]|tara:strand:- start:17657 stop:18952 length:1296 start_codon:yes stop_codon:yes gene_type:complete